MKMPRTLSRVIKATILTLCVLAVLWITLIAAPMWLARWRITHALADFHTIHLNESNWADTQRLMSRWGKWGHHEGTCTATACDYSISIVDPMSGWFDSLPGKVASTLVSLRLLFLAEKLGWHENRFFLRLTVEDDRIVKTSVGLSIGTTDSYLSFSDWGYALAAGAKTNSRLKRSTLPEKRHEAWILGNDEQLDLHPNYKAGRPGGCEICEHVEVTYTPQLSHDAIVRLTDYNLSCVTRIFFLCRKPADLLPAAAPWHIYDENEDEYPYPKNTPPVSCRTEPRALGRDADVVLEVIPVALLSEEKEPGTTGPTYTFSLKLLRVLKGRFNQQPGSSLQVRAFPGDTFTTPKQLAEPLAIGRKTLLLPDDITTEQTFYLRRCNIIDDTAENLAAIQLGIAQDIPYRHRPRFGE